MRSDQLLQTPPFIYHLPIALTLLRLLLSTLVVAFALWLPEPRLFGACLVLAFLSDVFDGVIARRLNIATEALRRLDSVADTVFYLSVVIAIAWVTPATLLNHTTALLLLLALELTRYAIDFRKFRREASYHLWSAKLWGMFLFLGSFSALVRRQQGLLVDLAIYLGILADLEGLAVSLVLTRTRTDVKTVFHALRERQCEVD